MKLDAATDHAGALTDPEHSDGERKKANDQKQIAHGPILIGKGCAATTAVRQPHGIGRVAPRLGQGKRR